MQPTEGRTENNSGQAVNGQIITNGSYSVFVDENGCGYSKCGGVLITRLRGKAWGAFGEDAANASEFGFVPPNGVDFVIVNMIPNQVKSRKTHFGKHHGGAAQSGFGGSFRFNSGTPHFNGCC